MHGPCLQVGLKDRSRNFIHNSNAMNQAVNGTGFDHISTCELQVRSQGNMRIWPSAGCSSTYGIEVKILRYGFHRYLTESIAYVFQVHRESLNPYPYSYYFSHQENPPFPLSNHSINPTSNPLYLDSSTTIHCTLLHAIRARTTIIHPRKRAHLPTTGRNIRHRIDSASRAPPSVVDGKFTVNSY